MYENKRKVLSVSILTINRKAMMCFYDIWDTFKINRYRIKFRKNTQKKKSDYHENL